MLASHAATPSPRLEVERVYRDHFEFVWANLRRFGVSPELLEDACHDVFVVVHRRAADFDPSRSSLRTWVFGIVRRVASDQRRARQRRERKLTRVRSLVAEHAPHSRQSVAEARTLAREFLGTIDEEQAAIFVLSALYGVPVREIAASLGLNPNTVASRLRATRSRLKALASAADLENLTREETPPEEAKARVLAGLCPLLVPPPKPAAFYGLKVAFVGLCVAGSVALLTSPQPAGTASPSPDEVFASHKVDAPGLVEPTIPDAPAVLEIQDDPRPAHTLRPPRPRAASPAVRVAPVIPVAPVVPGPSTASAPVDDVRAELALVTEARTAVRQGKPTVALRTANRYASRFPHGVLQTEMAVVRVDSLCRLGREEDASVVAGTLRGLHARPPTSVCPR